VDVLARSWPLDHAKWEASFQGRPPTALGDLGDVDGVLAFGLCVELRNAKSTSQAAGQATWPPDHLTLHSFHLAQLRQVGAA
jgi:hypothetical protein